MRQGAKGQREEKGSLRTTFPVWCRSLPGVPAAFTTQRPCAACPASVFPEQ